MRLKNKHTQKLCNESTLYKPAMRKIARKSGRSRLIQTQHQDSQGGDRSGKPRPAPGCAV
jgi:hypothetical protein